MRLNEWQQVFEDYLLGQSPTADPSLGASLIGGPSLDVSRGLAIYHNAYQARLLEVLRGDYPTVHHWLGDEEFDRLALAYVRQSPSAHFSLRWLGRGFAQFIKRHLVPEQSAPLAELAQLEWAFTLAFDAHNGMPLTLEQMARLPPVEWPGLRVQRHPSVQLLECHYNSLALWQAVKAQTEFPGSHRLPTAETCLVWRAERHCQYRSLPAPEARAFCAMVEGRWSFSELCCELAVTYSEEAPLQAATWLKQWVHDGLLQRRV